MFKKPIKEDKHPLAINVMKLQRYNFNFFSTEEVVFFEYLMVKGSSFKAGKQFYHSTETIFRETGIKKNSLNSIIKRFTELGIIKIEVKGFPKVKHFLVVFPRVMELFSQIYQSSENGKLPSALSKLLFDFFQPLAVSYLQKNTNKNLETELKKETNDIDSEWEHTVGVLKDFLFSLHYDKKIPESRLKADNNLLFAACKNYGLEQIVFYLKKYFSEKFSFGTLTEFLKADKRDPRKIVFIEQQLAIEKEHLKTFISKLERLHNQRRKKASNAKKEYSETSLVFNNASTKMLEDALRAKPEMDIENAFIVYCDRVLKGEIEPKKFLPLFFHKDFGEYKVIDENLDIFNLDYAIHSGK